MTEKSPWDMDWEEKGVWFAQKHPELVEWHNIYHGTKAKSLEKLESSGTCAFGSPKVAKFEINRALKTFGKEKWAHRHPTLYRSMVREVSEPQRSNIYITTDKDIACAYARRSPEFLGITMAAAGIPKEKITSYLYERFGEPAVITLKKQLPFDDANINSGKKCIRQEEIEKIEQCSKEKHLWYG